MTGGGRRVRINKGGANVCENRLYLLKPLSRGSRRALSRESANCHWTNIEGRLLRFGLSLMKSFAS